jgi:Fe-S cluster assembly protein SufD
MVNLIDADKRIFTNTRNLVIVGRNASLKLVHCDDSLSAHGSFVNTVTEFFVEDGGKLDFYKLQNKDEEATVITNNFIKQGRDSHTRSNTITLNGGLIRNDTLVKMNGRGGESEVYGLYLVDRRQFVDNHVFVDHAVSDCTSRQLFKGIADDNAHAVFNGHILVRQDAQHTEAYQNNNNIQLTDTAAIDIHPFLEIYADDVKCSHGATVGQLDTDALFYMKQRGICDHTARMLLMYSFAREVINRIQKSRKDSGFNVSDRIRVSINSGDRLLEAIKAHEDYIKRETLTLDLQYVDEPGEMVFDIDGEAMSLSMAVSE